MMPARYLCVCVYVCVLFVLCGAGSVCGVSTTINQHTVATDRERSPCTMPCTTASRALYMVIGEP